MTNFPRVAIIYLSYHSDDYMDDAISALEKMNYPKERVEFVVVDNPHPTFGSSVANIREKLLPLSEISIPHVTILPNKVNLGFSGGNNVGIKWAIQNGFDYVYFHNSDGFMTADCILELVKAMEKDKNIGEAQSLLLLYPETDLLNSTGNAFHYLGFGYVKSFREKKDSIRLNDVEEIGYGSGASLLMRASLLSKYGLWKEEFFMYHEDLEYSLRMKLLGYKNVIVKNSIFYHKYQFSRNKDKFYQMERNRYAVLLMYYKWQTLLMLAPIALVMEFGLLIYSGMNKMFKTRLEVYKYWLNWSNIKFWLGERKKKQAMRVVKDRELLKNACSQIIFVEKSLNNPLLRYIANPLMTLYWFVAKRIIFW